MQGFNMGRYVPPEHEGVLTANQASGKGHALGARASRLRSEGALTVRFEMPFAVWCDHCAPHPQLIAQGVRFNAAKRRVGAYFSTPVYSFRLRHAACGGEIEIRTDPASTAYVVVSGGRKRDEGAAADRDDSLVGGGGAAAAAGLLPGPGEREDLREKAFANLEKTIEDRAAFEAARARIDEIGEVSARQWDDPYARNQALRRSFRVGRKAREREAEVAEGIRDRMGLGIELLPESDEDARRARLVDFGTAPDREREESKVEGRLLARPLFGEEGTRDDKEDRAANASSKTPRRLKSEKAATRTKKSLVSEVVGNTRMVIDPFLEPRTKDVSKSAAIIPGLKRKRDPEKEPSPPAEEKPAEKVAVVSSLVDYDSD